MQPHQHEDRFHAQLDHCESADSAPSSESRLVESGTVELQRYEEWYRVSVHQRGVGRTSGVPTEMRYFTLWSFRGRKVIHLESFRERAAALEAAGLSE